MKRAAAELIYAALEKAAAEGERCPTNAEFAAELSKRGMKIAPQTIPSIVKRLTIEGRIIVQIYGGNWRQVTICAGAHTGEKTLPPAHGGEPYIVIDKDGLQKRYLGQ
jgi:hypothetical protein